MKYRVGIVILNYNSYDCTVRCVESIMDKEDTENVRIYIVNNGSSDDSLEKLKKKYNGNGIVWVMNSEYNGGYSYGNNIGIKQAISDGVSYIVIANPDTYLENAAISIMIDALDCNPEVGVGGPVLNQPDGNGQIARTRYTFGKSIVTKAPFRYLKIWPEKYKRDLEWNGKGNFIFEGTAAGCFLVLRADVIVSVGLLDEDFFLFNEEDVIAYKMLGVNKKCMIVPEAVVYHDHSMTTQKEGMPFIYYYYRISEYLLLCKYAHINTLQKIILYILNIGWFYMYSIKADGAKQYFNRLKKVYKYIYKGNYNRANEALYGKEL